MPRGSAVVTGTTGQAEIGKKREKKRKRNRYTEKEKERKQTYVQGNC